MYTIKKGELYVKADGAPGDSSYTRDARLAVKYKTREEAERNCCHDNERVVEMRLEWT